MVRRLFSPCVQYILPPPTHHYFPKELAQCSGHGGCRLSGSETLMLTQGSSSIVEHMPTFQGIHCRPE